MKFSTVITHFVFPQFFLKR